MLQRLRAIGLPLLISALCNLLQRVSDVFVAKNGAVSRLSESTVESRYFFKMTDVCPFPCSS